MEQSQQHMDFCLIIPCYNNFRGLIHSLQSIQYDTERFSVLIIDDGSTEPVLRADLLPHLSSPIDFIITRMPENAGITKALNFGLNFVKSRYHAEFIARLDCGDTCAPERFYRQVQFLRQHPQIDLVGSWCLFKNPATGSSYQYRTATEHRKITRGMHFRNMFIHPTVMWRNEKRKTYPEDFPHAEDYGFFYDMLNSGNCAVIAENLVICEINTEGISQRFRKEQLKSRMKVVKLYGKSNVFRMIGVIKLWMLLHIPYRLVLGAKHTLYGSQVLRPAGE